jgi:hypothetical protein
VLINEFFRFLGVPELTTSKITLGGGHESEASVPAYHGLNASSQHVLSVLFQPFDQLLRRVVIDDVDLNCAFP